MALKNVFLFFVLTCLMAYAVAGRNDLHNINNIKPGQNLAARLDADVRRVIECLNGIQQLNSCSYVYIQFLLTGKISPECCHAVDIVTSKCLPPTNDLLSLGFTPKEGNLLKGVCDASSPAPAAAPPAPSAAGTPPAASPISG